MISLKGRDVVVARVGVCICKSWAPVPLPQEAGIICYYINTSPFVILSSTH